VGSVCGLLLAWLITIETNLCTSLFDIGGNRRQGNNEKGAIEEPNEVYSSDSWTSDSDSDDGDDDDDNDDYDDSEKDDDCMEFYNKDGDVEDGAIANILETLGFNRERF
jgi:hypothetical protein